MTMEIDALHAGQPMRNSLDPCNTCAEWQQQAERVRVLREALEMLYSETADYIRLNNLGGMDNQSIRMARAALEATQ